MEVKQHSHEGRATGYQTSNIATEKAAMRAAFATFLQLYQ
jgi:hypothetical protein